LCISTGRAAFARPFLLEDILMPDDRNRTVQLDTMDRLGLDPEALQKVRVRELTDIQRARVLKVRPEALASTTIVLRPSKPSGSKGYLSFYSSPMVLSNPLPSNDIAVFSSSFQGAVFPGIQVEFTPIKKGKLHLVEFHVTLNQPKTYMFRVFAYPLATFQDIALEQTQVITALVPPAEGISTYGAAIQQRNPVADGAGWLFHRVRISAVS
jgi:hypothetical protein